MKKPRLSVVEALPGYRLRLVWVDGSVTEVGLREPVFSLRPLESLRDPAAFAQARLGEWGWSAEWPGDIQVGADTLWIDWLEQSGQAWPQAQFLAWKERNGLSLAQAAEALGLTRRMVTYYVSRSRPIPKTVGLACLGWEAMHMEKRQVG